MHNRSEFEFTIMDYLEDKFKKFFQENPTIRVINLRMIDSQIELVLGEGSFSISKGKSNRLSEAFEQAISSFEKNRQALANKLILEQEKRINLAKENLELELRDMEALKRKFETLPDENDQEPVPSWKLLSSDH